MAEEADRGVSSRAERKALQKAKILQEENERKIFKQVRRGDITFVVFLRLARFVARRLWRLQGAAHHRLFLSFKLKVRRALKKPETERSEEEAAVLVLHRETVEELYRRQVRATVLKRKQEEVKLSAIKTGLGEF